MIDMYPNPPLALFVPITSDKVYWEFLWTEISTTIS